MKIIAINGAKHSRKDLLALKLSENSDCIWVHPYTTMDVPKNQEEYEQDRFIHLSEEKLKYKMDRETPLATVELDGNLWVFFETQMRAEYCVLIADDLVLSYLKDNWKGDLFTIKCRHKDEKNSDRCMLPDSFFDAIFRWGIDDYDELEALIQYE